MITIHPLSAATPHKTLGHWKAPTGTSTTQLRAIKTKAKQLSVLIATSPIPRYGARLAYIAKYVASLRYVLPQCHFNPKTLRKAERQSMHSIISKCGFSSRSPHAILFTPTWCGGGGFIHWDTIQGTGQITHFLKHWNIRHTQPSDLLRIGVAWAQWQAGVQEPIFANPSFPCEYIECRWLKSLRHALSSANASLRFLQTFIYTSDRLNDPFLMDVAIQSGAFSDKELKIVNYCRLYLHVLTVSEMFNVAWHCDSPAHPKRGTTTVVRFHQHHHHPSPTQFPSVAQTLDSVMQHRRPNRSNPR